MATCLFPYPLIHITDCDTHSWNQSRLTAKEFSRAFWAGMILRGYNQAPTATMASTGITRGLLDPWPLLLTFDMVIGDAKIYTFEGEE